MKNKVIVTCLIIIAISSQLRAMESHDEQQLQTIIKELGKIKIPVVPLQDKPLYPELDIDPRKKATLERIVEQYLNEGTSASPLVKKIEEITKLPLATLSGHSKQVRSVDFSPNGKMIASGSWDQTIKLWNIDTKKEIALLSGGSVFGELVDQVAFSPDGKTIAFGLSGGIVRLWDVANKKVIAILRGHQGWVSSVVFNSNGKMVASGSADTNVKLWDVATAKEIATLSGHSEWVQSVAFSPDGKTVASGSRDKTIKLWDVATAKEIATLSGHSDWVESVAFSPDGKTLASASYDGTIRLWDVATTNEIALFGHRKLVKSVAFSLDSKTLASGSADTTIKLWDASSAKEIAQLSDHEGWVNSVAFSPAGKLFASGSADGTIKLWDVRPYTELVPFLQTLFADAKGIKKFLLLRTIFEHFEKTKEALLLYQPEAIALLKELPAWLQKPLQEKQMVRVFKKVGNAKGACNQLVQISEKTNKNQ